MATTTEIIEAAEKAAVTVTITQHPKGTGEIVPLPGVSDVPRVISRQ